jgi:hypothetical protein
MSLPPVLEVSKETKKGVTVGTAIPQSARARDH